MTEPERPGFGARRQHPQDESFAIDLVDRHPAVDNPLGGDPLRIVGEVAGIGGVGLEHAERAAAAHQHAADGQRLGQSDAQMPVADVASFAEFYARQSWLGRCGPNDARRIERRAADRQWRFGAAHPLAESLFIERRGGDRLKRPAGGELFSAAESGASGKMAMAREKTKSLAECMGLFVGGPDRELGYT